MSAGKMRQIATSLESHPKVKLAWVYGSFATGTEKADSDIDVAIAGAKPFTAGEKVALALELSKLVKREIDLVDLQRERGIIATQVLTRGTLIVKKDRDMLAMLIKRMWLDGADYAPQRDRVFRARREKAFGKK